MTNYKITQHAAIRFLERVFNIEAPTAEQIENVKVLLLKDIANISTQAYIKYIPIPSFDGFIAVKVENAITTILFKNKIQYIKSRKKLSY
jgi:hypothetical protein